MADSTSNDNREAEPREATKPNLSDALKLPETANVPEAALSSTDEQVVLSFKPRLAASTKSLPVPGGLNSNSDSMSEGNEDAVSEKGEDDDDPLTCREELDDPLTCREELVDDPLTCREELPSPPSNYLDEENVGEGGYGMGPDYVTNKADFLRRSVSTYPQQERGDTAPRMYMNSPQRRTCHSAVPVKPPRSLPDKSEPPRKRARARPLPTASSRKPVSPRGRVQKKRAFESSTYPNGLPASMASISQLKRLATTPDTETILNSSMQLAYSWDSLGLGKELGSAALNEYMTRLRNTEEVSPYLPDFTAQEMLQIMNGLRVRTYLPPPGSDLHRIVQKNRFENRSELYGNGDERVENGTGVLSESVGDGGTPDHSGDPPACSIPFKTMARLYETMCAQDADDGSSNRREAQYLSASAAIEKLRSLENRACELKLRESEVIEKGRELGLIGSTHRLLPGYARVPDGSSLEPVSEGI